MLQELAIDSIDVTLEPPNLRHAERARGGAGVAGTGAPAFKRTRSSSVSMELTKWRFFD